MTTAHLLSEKCTVNELGAFEMSYDLAENVSEHDGFDVIRFEDGSSARVEMTSDHEVFINEI